MSNRADYHSKICSFEEALKLRADWEIKKEAVVFTNGVFDLLHPGHVQYLSEAKALGDRLIIGLNSDSSARLLGKGTGRPINDQQARALVLAGLQFVDTIVIFDESTPLQLIEKMLPDVLVKGGDYRLDQIVGADIVMQNGGDVKQLNFLEGYSTTAIEQRILEAGLNKQ